MSIPPVLLSARELFLEEWRDALGKLTNDEAREFVIEFNRRMRAKMADWE